MQKKLYTVQEVAQYANVTIRTLHHYHQIGLLKPKKRLENGTRLYDRESLYELQQILLYKQAGIPLQDIEPLLNKGIPERLEQLTKQRNWIECEKERLATLLSTIDKTINELKNTKTMMTEKELYAGFSNEKAQKMRNEVKERWGADELEKSESHLKQKTPAEFKALKMEGEAIVKRIAKGMNLEGNHPEIQALVAEYFESFKGFRPELNKEGYAQLAELYTSDERFAQYYNDVADGLADYISKAILYFCKS